MYFLKLAGWSIGRPTYSSRWKSVTRGQSTWLIRRQLLEELELGCSGGDDDAGAARLDDGAVDGRRGVRGAAAWPSPGWSRTF